MAFASFDSAGVYWFSLTIDGIEFQTIKKVDGLEMQIETVETKQVNMKGQPIQKKWAANKKFLGEVTVSRMMTDDTAWADWLVAAEKNVAAARKSASVTVYNQLNAPVRTYKFTNTWPTSVGVSGLDASSNSPVEETMKFVYEEISFEKG